MASRRKNPESKSKGRPPATTPEARERQLVDAAVDLAEKQLQEGTASSQVITHYLKLGSSREMLEQERLERENELLRVKAETMASARRVEEMYKEALEAMRSYAGQEPLDQAEDYDE